MKVSQPKIFLGIQGSIANFQHKNMMISRILSNKKIDIFQDYEWWVLEKLTASETHRIKRLLIVKFLSQEKLKGLSPLNHGLVKKQILWSGYLKPDNQTSTGDWSHIYLTYQLDSIDNN